MYNEMQMPACDALCIYLSSAPAVGSCLADAWVADRSSRTSPIGGSDEHTYLKGNIPGVQFIIAESIVKTQCFYSNRIYRSPAHSVWYYQGGIPAWHSIHPEGLAD